MNTDDENKKTDMFGENEIFELNQDCVSWIMMEKRLF